MAVDFPKEAEVYAKTRDGFLFSLRLVHEWRDGVPETVEVDVTDYTGAGINYVVVGSALVSHFTAGAQTGAVLESGDVVQSAGRRYLRLNYRTYVHVAGGAGRIYRIQLTGAAVKT